jgi:glutathione S-transferase
MCELARRAHSDLWPLDERQIDIVRWLSWASQHMVRAGGTLYFEYIIKPRFKIGPPNEADTEQATADFRFLGRILNDHLRGREWLVGDGLTVADFVVAAPLPYAKDAQIPLAEFPEVRRWHDQLNAFDAWRNPYPVRSVT